MPLRWLLSETIVVNETWPIDIGYLDMLLTRL